MHTPGTIAMRLAAVAAATTLSLGLVACGSGKSTSASSRSSSSSSAPAAAAGDGKVQIKDFKYAPETITVKAGTAVVVTNGDNQPHTFTSDETGAFDSGSIPAGGSPMAPITVMKAGTYAFH